MDIDSVKLKETLFEECMPIFKEVFGQEIDLDSEDDVAHEAVELFGYELLPIYRSVHDEDVYDKTRTFTQREVDRILFSFRYFVDYHLIRIQQEKIIRKHLPKELRDKLSFKKTVGYTDYGTGYSNRHFIFQDVEGNKFHIKAVLNDVFYNKYSRSNEVFIYKLLELLGYGPKMQAIFVKELKTVFLVNDDLANKKQEKSKKQTSFWIASDKKFPLPKAKKAQEHFIACNFLVDFLELADIYTNRANYGIKLSSEDIETESRKFKNQQKDDEGNEKIEKKLKIEKIGEGKNEKMKMMILDFHLALAAKPLKFEQLIEKYYTKVGQIREQQAWLVEDNIMLNILKDKRPFARVVERLKKGNKNGKPSLENALETAFNFAAAIFRQIKEYCETDECAWHIREAFDLIRVEKLKNYYLEKWQNLIKNSTFDL